MVTEAQSAPCWVLVNDELVNVSDYSHLIRSARPDAYCPVCKEKVTLKLGKVRAHHFAHKNNTSRCVLTNPETAIHFNAKMHVWRLLKESNTVNISRRCSLCRSRRVLRWQSDWDDVQVEFTTAHSNYRPDVAILKNGEVVGAIEIFYTNAISSEKIEAYESHGIDWLEVSAKAALSWNGRSTFPYNHPHIENWVCLRCKRRHKNLPKQKKLHPYTKQAPILDPLPFPLEWKAPPKIIRLDNEPVTIDAFRVVDFYYQDGTYRRDTIYRNSQQDRSWCDLRSNEKVVAFIKQPIGYETREYLHQQVKLYLLSLGNNYDVDYLTDSWLPYDSVKERQLRGLSQNYKWANGEWVRVSRLRRY